MVATFFALTTLALAIALVFVAIDRKFYKNFYQNEFSNAKQGHDTLILYQTEYKEMLDVTNRTLASNKELLESNQKLIERSMEDAYRCHYYLYLIKKFQNALNYANTYLKPRKRREMWHRANDFVKYEVWRTTLAQPLFGEDKEQPIEK